MKTRTVCVGVAVFLFVCSGLLSVVFAQHPGWPDSNFHISTLDWRVYDALCAFDGKIYICGSFTEYDGYERLYFARLKSDGTMDTSYKLDFNLDAREMAIDTNGAIVVAGYFWDVDGHSLSGIAKLRADGYGLDLSFNPGSGFSGSAIYDVEIDQNNKILVGGSLSQYNGTNISSIIRLHENGALDTSFQGYIAGGLGYDVYDIAVNGLGSILVAGSFTNVNGYARSQVALLFSDGSLDHSFYPICNNEVHVADWDGIGRIVIGGKFTTVNGQTRNHIARLYSDGTVDTSFSTILNDYCYDLTVLPDGKILICGSFTWVNSTYQPYIARLNEDGSLDTTFTSGAGNPNDYVSKVRSLPSGKTLVCGQFTSYGGVAADSFLRIQGDRTTDCDFDGDGLTDVTFFDPDSGGWYVYSSVASGLYLDPPVQWGWQTATPVPFDIDSDGRCDWIVFDAATGNWYINGTASPAEVINWGWSASVPVPGDYDGDRKMDLAVFYPENGNWYIRDAATEQLRVINWGWSGSIPVPADYDGDGTTDLAVYDLALGTWYISESKSGAFTVINWGWSGAAPYPVDYDNNGCDDLAVFDANTGNWYIRYDLFFSDTITFDVSGWSWKYGVPGLYSYNKGYTPAIYKQAEGYWSFEPYYNFLHWGWYNSWPVDIQTQINSWYGF